MTIVAEARAKGVMLWLEGERVKYKGPKEVIKDLLPKLRADRRVVVAELVDEQAKTRLNVYSYRLDGESGCLIYLSPGDLSEAKAWLKDRFSDRLVDVKEKPRQ